MNKDQSDRRRSKGGLGRGLSALLSDVRSINEGDVEETTEILGSVNELPVDQIETNPFQPRTQFDEEALEELRASIEKHGIIQPITVRKLSNGSYQLISGERRLQASKRAGLIAIPAFIRLANDEELLQLSLIENIQRQDLNPIEIAFAYKRLMDECNLVIEQVGDRVGKKRPTINNYLRLLKLPPEIQAGLRDAVITMGHARAIAGLEDPVMQLEVYKTVLEKELSVRETELLVSRQSQGGQEKKSSRQGQDDDPIRKHHLHEISRSLGHKYNTKIQIQSKSDGQGEIRIRFYSDDDLNRLLELLQ